MLIWQWYGSHQSSVLVRSEEVEAEAVGDLRMDCLKDAMLPPMLYGRRKVLLFCVAGCLVLVHNN